MRDVSGVDGAGPIWRAVLAVAVQGDPGVWPEPPAGVVQATICSPTGLIPGPDCPSPVHEWFVAGTVPTSRETYFGRSANGELTVNPPPAARPWALEAGLRLADETAGDAGMTVQILQPSPGSVFYLSPELDSQVLLLKASFPPAAQEVEFRVDGAEAALAPGSSATARSGPSPCACTGRGHCIPPRRPASRRRNNLRGESTMNGRILERLRAMARDRRWIILVAIAVGAVVVALLTMGPGTAPAAGHRTRRFRRFPAGEEVPRLTPVKVTFKDAPEERDPAKVLKLEPEVKGDYAWVSDRILLFRPESRGFARPGVRGQCRRAPRSRPRSASCRSSHNSGRAQRAGGYSRPKRRRSAEGGPGFRAVQPLSGAAHAAERAIDEAGDRVHAPLAGQGRVAERPRCIASSPVAAGEPSSRPGSRQASRRLPMGFSRRTTPGPSPPTVLHSKASRRMTRLSLRAPARRSC